MMSLLTFSLLYCIKQIDSMLLCVCSVTGHRRHQNVLRTSVTHSPNGSCVTFFSLPHFDIICGLLPKRRTSTWNLFVIKVCILSLLSPESEKLTTVSFHPFLFHVLDTNLDNIVVLFSSFLWFITIYKLNKRGTMYNLIGQKPMVY